MEQLRLSESYLFKQSLDFSYYEVSQLLIQESLNKIEVYFFFLYLKNFLGHLLNFSHLYSFESY